MLDSKKKLLWIATSMTTLLMLIVMNNTATGQDIHLNVGESAPSFEASDHNGEIWKSTRHEDEILVVFFYPAAMTGGCTNQACSFRDNRTQLTEMGAEVVGISGDRVENLKLFRRANNLNFPLLSDSDGSIADAFGVPTGDGGTITTEVDGEMVELTRDITTARWTFVIDRNGNIAYVDTEVDAAGDGEAVIAAIKQMNE